MDIASFRPNDASAVARLFSTKIVSELAQYNYSKLFLELLNASGLTTVLQRHSTVKDAFELAFTVLKKRDYRHEYIYKAALFEKVQMGSHSLNTACMINEFRVGKSKADTVLFNGTATAYEIKSERDSLSRLKTQIEDYFAVFPSVYVIAGENHLTALENQFPRDLGILLLSRRFCISTIREATPNFDNLCAKKILSCVRMSEAKQMLNSLGYEIPDVPNTKIYNELEHMFDQVEPERLHQAMVVTVKANRSLAPLSDFLNNVPVSLHSAVVSAKLKKNEKPGLLIALSTPIYDMEAV